MVTDLTSPSSVNHPVTISYSTLVVTLVSGSFYDVDGSWGYRDADGSISYHGSDGSWGYKNADGSGSFYGSSGSSDFEYDNDADKCSNGSSLGEMLGTIIGIGLPSAFL